MTDPDHPSLLLFNLLMNTNIFYGVNTFSFHFIDDDVGLCLLPLPRSCFILLMLLETQNSCHAAPKASDASAWGAAAKGPCQQKVETPAGTTPGEEWMKMLTEHLAILVLCAAHGPDIPYSRNQNHGGSYLVKAPTMIWNRRIYIETDRVRWGSLWPSWVWSCLVGNFFIHVL